MDLTVGNQTEGHMKARYFVFMGVSGVGKSTVANAMATSFGGSMVEADDLHSPGNIKTMSQGRPLTDSERWPWLQAVCEAALNSTPPAMIACSALRLNYRDFIRSMLDGAIFIHLAGPPELIRRRMAERRSHFMRPNMLESQISALEIPADEPSCHSIDISGSQDEVIARAKTICRQYLEHAGQAGATTGVDRKR